LMQINNKNADGKDSKELEWANLEFWEELITQSTGRYHLFKHAGKKDCSTTFNFFFKCPNTSKKSYVHLQCVHKNYMQSLENASLDVSEDFITQNRYPIWLSLPNMQSGQNLWTNPIFLYKTNFLICENIMPLVYIYLFSSFLQKSTYENYAVYNTWHCKMFSRC
jgi:hypothetical protein